MRIKPYVILGLATLCAGAGLAVVVTTADPYTSQPYFLGMFWVSLFLSTWGLVATLISIARQRLVYALQIGLAWAVSTVGLLALARKGYHDWRLSAGVILATIVLSLIVWIRSKKSGKPPLMN